MTWFLLVYECQSCQHCIQKNVITWLMGQHIEVVMLEFKNQCGLFNLYGMINNMHHISTSKPNILFVDEYYYHKTWNYHTSCSGF